MRIVIDLQGAQAENRSRGIGRYSLSLALSLARNINHNELLIVLNGAFPESIGPIREAFCGLIPAENICVWSAPGPFAADPNHAWQRQSASIIRDAFLASLRPDVVLVSSLFEGFGGEAITDIAGVTVPCLKAVILYDLIPLIHPEVYLKNADFAAWYTAKLNDLKHADYWFSISESSRKEGVEALALPADRVVAIGTDASDQFRLSHISDGEAAVVLARHGLNKAFVMYTGGIDHRKNIPALIRSFAALPPETRLSHQLAIVCSISEPDRRTLTALVKDCGLGQEEVIFTGFVCEEDLVSLYNLCKLFVFPSWHEGFGLPALEAMRCGAPVIAGNLSSLPEVIGWDEALFDPHSELSITAALLKGLEDERFRQNLIAHGTQQARHFSWDSTAKKLISSIAGFLEEKSSGSIRKEPVPRRPKLAYVSPLPPERSGIADYSAELLPYLAKFYEIDVIINQPSVSDPWISAHCAIRNEDWLTDHASDYERVVYHFGNSAFHEHMFDLIEQVPGVVVLHDFFLSGLVSFIDGSGLQPGLLETTLYRSHGYPAIKARYESTDPAEVVWTYPCNLSVIQNSLGTIVHSENSVQLCHHWYKTWPQDWQVIPHLRVATQGLPDPAAVRASLGFKADDFIVCAFGILGPSKLNHRLVDAWLNSSLANSGSCYLIFVGENDKGLYGQRLSQRIKESMANQNIRITGWADVALFRNYLGIADVGVQLRTLSRGETSGTVLDCMNYGVPTIINCNGSMSDISDDVAIKLPDEFTDAQLVEGLETLWRDEALRRLKGRHARETIVNAHAPERCAAMYHSAIERFYEHAMLEAPGIPNRIAQISEPQRNANLVDLAEKLSSSFPAKIRQPQLLLDVSELVTRDAKSGIQRVVKSVLHEWLNTPPHGYRVEPVYASINEPYRYARWFTLDFLNCSNKHLDDEPIDVGPGDVLFVLDLQPSVQVAQASYYQWLRARGVVVKFMVYDLLCVTMPQYFSPGAKAGFEKWLDVVASSDGAICISRSVSEELSLWLKTNKTNLSINFYNGWFHLGAEMLKAGPSLGFTADSAVVLNSLEKKVSFLMVGTIEPRKGYEEALAAFEVLWRSGVNVNLTIVGKPGWLVDQLVEKLERHDELNRRLFWLNGISDEYLEAVYKASDCLIAASYGEGFGLPLIEAAHHSLSIFARDIPVFKEVGGDNAYYFHSESAEDLANELQKWLSLYSQNSQPSSEGLHWKSWDESAAWLANGLLSQPLHPSRQPS